MTDMHQHRVSLLLVFIGTSLLVLQTWDRVWSTTLMRVTLPTFTQSAPDLREWPTHTYLPIG